jgi:hypothetical protein
MRALSRLYAASLVPGTFSEYGGHLLLAFALIARTSRSARIRRAARQMGAERALAWRQQWPATCAALNSDTLMHAVIASHAATQLGAPDEHVWLRLAQELGKYSSVDLLYFDPAADDIPDDVPQDCACGRTNGRRARRCAECSRTLECRSRYDVWYYALTSVYFCERHGLPLPVTFARTLSRLRELRPYPRPGAPDFYDAIYAVTHVVYTLNDYGALTLPPTLLPYELAFLRSSVQWALQQEEPDTVGELIDSMVGIGVPDTDPQIVNARRFLLDTQRPDGTWGAEGGDAYGYFHTLWTAIDGLRDHTQRSGGAIARRLQAVLDELGVAPGPG